MGRAPIAESSTIVSFTIPTDLLEKVDAFLEGGRGRSKVFRDALTAFLEPMAFLKTKTKKKGKKKSSEKKSVEKKAPVAAEAPKKKSKKSKKKTSAKKKSD